MVNILVGAKFVVDSQSYALTIPVSELAYETEFRDRDAVLWLEPAKLLLLANVAEQLVRQYAQDKARIETLAPRPKPDPAIP